MTMTSKIPDTISSDDIQNLSFKIQNFSTKNIYVSNVPILSFNYKILKKIGNSYLSIDSTCRFLPQPLYPPEGLKVVKFKRNEKINIIFGFPPLCSLYENGDYKIKFSFAYSKRNGINMAETEWYEYRVNIMK
jgi:hypothetical protein